jgi:hypothetical protein
VSVQSLMTAVHEVSELLHILGQHNRVLSRALFERLVSCGPVSPCARAAECAGASGYSAHVWLQVERGHGCEQRVCGGA